MEESAHLKEDSTPQPDDDTLVDRLGKLAPAPPTPIKSSRLSGPQARKIAADALQLMESGYTIPQIAPQMGLSVDRLTKLVHRELDRQVTPHVDQYRALQMNRYERIIRGIEAAAYSGDLFAIDRLRQILNDINGLLGLKAPVTANLNVTSEHNEKRTVRLEIGEKIAEITKKLSGGGIGELTQGAVDPETSPIDSGDILDGELVEGSDSDEGTQADTPPATTPGSAGDAPR